MVIAVLLTICNDPNLRRREGGTRGAVKKIILIVLMVHIIMILNMVMIIMIVILIGGWSQ